MKILFALLLVTTSCAPYSWSRELEWWLTDKTDPKVTRHVDVWRASKVEFADGAMRLYSESGGKLYLLFESKDADALASVKANIGYNPGIIMKMDDGSFVFYDKVSAIDLINENGKETAILRGQTMELGRTSDAEIVKLTKARVARKKK